jgi:hypothetical protein
MWKDTTPVLPSMAGREARLRPWSGRLRPLTAALRRAAEDDGQSRPDHLKGTTPMNSSIDNSSTTINAREIPSDERLRILPRHFGRHMLTVEGAVYGFMRKLAPQYTGGYWDYFELSNGGFYMAPAQDAPISICVEGNGFEGAMSAEAAGITACLFAMSHLSFQIEHESIAEHYHQLRDFVLDHAEASVILAAID